MKECKDKKKKKQPKHGGNLQERPQEANKTPNKELKKLPHQTPKQNMESKMAIR